MNSHDPTIPNVTLRDHTSPEATTRNHTRPRVTPAHDTCLLRVKPIFTFYNIPQVSNQLEIPTTGPIILSLNFS